MHINYQNPSTVLTLLTRVHTPNYVLLLLIMYKFIRNKSNASGFSLASIKQVITALCTLANSMTIPLPAVTLTQCPTVAVFLLNDDEYAMIFSIINMAMLINTYSKQQLHLPSDHIM